ncbi:ABC transporter permease [Georgenia sp. EYE_87]|uniref:ABC transporter permease n=1 Tax=Georgenia sp. EYE_87 TaxID=2853448 RepID=UPI0020058495|nr:ABC transporter permease [Georgenia sp. EYE_87]MCK6210949.1 ABC transporter permease [Georgenia sp. EYE_87]
MTTTNGNRASGPAGIPLDYEPGDKNAPLTAELPEVATGDVPAATRRLSRRRIILRRFLRNRTAVVGLVGYLLLAAFAVAGPYLSPWTYTQIDQTAFLKPPSDAHWLGTTQAGRDVFALTAEGLRKSMLIGLGVAVVQTLVAATIGSFAAYYGRWFDKVALWVIDLLLVVPSFFIIAIISVQTGQGRGSVIMLILLLAGLGWMLSARVVRSMTLGIKGLEYVTAAKYMSVSTPKIIFRHVIPNISSLLIIDATLAVASAVLAETSLSFFGFGVQAPETSLGTLIAEGQRMASTYPWIFLAPATVLTLMLIFINFVGDGLRDALDPSSRSGGRA